MKKAKVKLNVADNKFLKEFCNLTESDFKADPIKRSNKFTGQEFDVDPICEKCIDFIFKLEGLINSRNLARIQASYPTIKSIGGAIQKFDRARMLVLKMDSEVYMGILD